MKPRLIQQQTLQWKMNQSLIQSINILQFSSLELKDYVDQLSKENPLIEEVNYDDAFERYRTSANQVAIGEINAAEKSMYERLKDQLVGLSIPKKLKPVVEYGIDSLDSDGYLDLDLTLWAEHCSVSVELVEQAIEYIQALEPAGIGARSLSECITIQLKQMQVEAPFVRNLLDEHLEWVATEDIEAITLQYDTSEERVLDLINMIKLCHPKPGQLLDSEAPEYIIPEASIYREDGVWKIKFFKWATPVIKVTSTYRDIKDLGRDATNYLKEKYKQIENINKAILYRTNTLESIIQIIVEKQYYFFEEGMVMLKPLTLREVAEDLDIHLSTVSRAINQKYVQTKQGVLPLKFFFQSGIRQENGRHTAASAIKHFIVSIIQQEDKKKPLSDQMIKNKLDEEYGIKIARRTVMKYREQLKISSSVKRRK
ncbi:RNA polymerase factor sigma-54 [Oceanobacillus bengalensis]|uniref:RNA polymerase sigma-54 factor n=1 Tax=Oceanobacillus bengalensis TaxID=1435466 RepID=A0A494Z6P8_9BACI|nr:RNA polymerase factor sigma-54 [Oceanobacillus bengalensis]RKQ18258.1 RNA polymerase sigma-54 factor [Oceanobacillus bengalensis]